MNVFVGLGNPGQRYQTTRHNAGFLALDAIMERYSFGVGRARWQGLIYEGDIDGVRLLAVKPQTYMNESGLCIGSIQRYYKLDVSSIFVFYDEMDLPVGKLRVRTEGRSAGHRGIESIIRHCGEKFNRVRIGIGRPSRSDQSVGHVLGHFAAREADWWGDYMGIIADHAPLLLENAYETFQNRVHRASQELI